MDWFVNSLDGALLLSVVVGTWSPGGLLSCLGLGVCVNPRGTPLA